MTGLEVLFGEVAERTKAPDSKSGGGVKASPVGSNPTLSAMLGPELALVALVPRRKIQCTKHTLGREKWPIYRSI